MNRMPFIDNIDAHLSFKCNISQRKFMAERLFINNLQQPRPQMPVNLYRRPDNLLSHMILSHRFGDSHRDHRALRGL